MIFAVSTIGLGADLNSTPSFNNIGGNDNVIKRWSGSKVVSPSSSTVVVSLTDSVTAIERDSLDAHSLSGGSS